MSSGAAPQAQLASLVQAGLARAEAGLSGLLAAPMSIAVDTIHLEPVLGVGRLVATPEAEVVGIYVGFSGDLAGHCLLCLDQGSAAHLAAGLLGDAAAQAELADSALLEVGNITVSGLVNGIADRGGWCIHVSPPALGRDMLGALVNTVLAAASLTASELLAVKGRFRSDAGDISGTILLLPDADSLRLLGGPGRAVQ